MASHAAAKNGTISNGQEKDARRSVSSTSSRTLDARDQPRAETTPREDNEKLTQLNGNQDPDAEDGGRRESKYDSDYEVSFEGENDPEDPKSIGYARKWLITITVALSSMCVTTNSSIYTFTYDQLVEEFNSSREVATLGLTTFVLGLGVAPMVLAPMSEFYGRRNVYIVAYIWVFIWIIPCAVAPNMATILVTRFFDGIGASTFLSVAGGTIGDMFNKEQLMLPMMVYSGSPFIGPAIGPIIGGFINQYASWRWTFWVLLIWTAVQTGLIVLFIPETYAPVLLRRKAERLRKETGNTEWHAPIEKLDRTVAGTVLWSCIRPFQLLVLEPMVLNLCILSALLLGILYLFFGAFVVVFETNHGFDLSQVGLTFIGLLTGMVLGLVSGPIWTWNYGRLLRNREARTGEKGVSDPEMRLPPTIAGAQLVWIGLFGFGWTTYSFVHWIVPIIFSSLVGMGIVLCYSGIFTFFVESYPLYAASALAANSFARSGFAAVFPLFGTQMYNNLGFQWASSLLGFLCLAMAPFPYIFFRYGKRIRKRSKFAKP